ncbi:hypothetical protein HCX50_04155 [Microbacterium oxydans]|uniref:hypothetical protein n=1 Tax=Microbacterium sp. B19(2022) TaxID=2914045 RepID=UPI001430A9E1|nr:hypothetical protein [Microbacterium sp. B19(2022)]NJI58619.1 hypothetical protein [Microbacterium sp. B19(2022)]
MSSALNLDEELRSIVGVGNFQYKRAMAVTGPMPMAMFNNYVDIIDRSGVPQQLEEWAGLERKRASGRKALLTFRAVLVVELISAVWSKGAQYTEFADTYAHRLTRAQFESLGIAWESVNEDRWLHRHWRAKKRLTKLVDPYHRTQKRRRLSLAEQVIADAARDEQRSDRLRWMRQSLVDASVALLPQRYRDRYTGDVAVDSTEVPILGRVHSQATTFVRRGLPLDHPKVREASKSLKRGGLLTNVDFSAGTYDRSHREDAMDEPPRAAYEMDIVTMMDTKGYDHHPAFARIITGVGFHRPGNITDEPREAMHQHARNFEQRGIAAADRAFNGLMSENFSQACRIDGWEFAYDYTKEQFGVQATVPGLPIVVVDGQLYVEYMPKELKYMTKWFRTKKKLNEVTGLPVTAADVERAIEARKPYAMKRHGDISNKAHNRGDQRFTYPDPKSYMAYDPATDKRIPVSKNNLRGSVTIHPHPEVVRHLQRHPWGSQEWKAVYGQRNQVESVNNSIKHTRFTDLESAAKRPGRGEAYHSIATALMAVAYNIRVLVRALVEECTPAEKKRRKSRKKFTIDDLPNVRPATVGALAPPA